MQIRSARRRRLGRLGHLLVVAIVLVTLAASQLEAQEPSPRPPQAVSAQVSERSRKALEEAERLLKANDLKGAIKLLGPIAAGDDAEVSLLLRLGELCAYALDFEATDKWFRRAIERADRSGEPLPRDHIMIGRTLYTMKRYPEAIPILEAGWRLGGRRIDSYYVIILARSYETTGAMRSAQQTYQTVLASDPGNVEAWSALARIKAKAAVGNQAPPGADVPSPPRLKEFDDVIRLGDPRRWSPKERVKGLAVYKRYAEALEHSDVDLSIRTEQRAAAMAAVKPCIERPDDHSIERSMNCIRSIARMAQTRPIDIFDTTYQRLIYLNLLAAHTDMEQFVHGLSDLEHFVTLPAIEEWADDASLVNRFLIDTFTSVSWNKRTSQLRENDSDDFVELLVSDPPSPVAVPGETAERRAGEAERPRHGGPRRITGRAPYGAASPDEDFVTVGDWASDFDDDFYKLILLRIKQKNFELPVKVLLNQLATRNSEDSTGVNDRYLPALDSAIKEAGEDVSPTTLEAYVVAKRLFELLKPKKQHPHALPAKRRSKK